MALDDIKAFVQVSDALATAGQPSEEELGEVAANGYEVVINLGLLDPRYCLADEAGLVAGLGLDYRHIPVEFSAPTAENLDAFFEAMDAAAGKRAFVHCAANMRVSVFVSLFGEARLGWTRAQADAHVARLWQPNEVWAAFLAESRRRLGLPDPPPLL